MIGFSESVGHSITFKVYNEATNSVLFRSGVRKVIKGSDVNNRITPTPPPPPGPSPMSSADDPKISEIVKSTNEENGERLAGSIVDYVGNFGDELEGDKERIEFKVKVGKRRFSINLLLNIKIFVILLRMKP